MEPEAVIRALVDGVAQRRWDDLPALYSEDAVVEHPMAPIGLPPLHGRDELRRHFQRAPVEGLAFTAENLVVHRTADPEVVVGEFEYCGRNAAGAPFRIRNVFVTRIRDGLIVESRDYADHLAFARARGTVGDLAAAIAAADA